MLNTLVLALFLYFLLLVVVYAVSRLSFPGLLEKAKEQGVFCVVFFVVGLVLTLMFGAKVSEKITSQLPRVTTTETIELSRLGAVDVKPESYVLLQVKSDNDRFYMIKSVRRDGEARIELIRALPSVTLVESDALGDRGLSIMTCTSPDATAEMAAFAYRLDRSVCIREIRVPRGTVETHLLTR